MAVKTTRNRLIDVAKGLSILLVVLGHSHILDTEVNRAFSSFRMPFFFFISGIFFRYKESFRTFAFSKSDSLLKPYFITLIIAALVDGFDNGAYWSRLVSILYGVGNTIKWPWSPLWFLPHLWLVFISSYFLIQFKIYKKEAHYLNVLLFVLLLFIGHLTTKSSPDQDYIHLGSYVEKYGLPLSAEILPISLIFFLLGHTLREKVKIFIPSLLIFSLCIAIFVISHNYFDIYVDLNHRVYRNVFTAMLVAICGMYFSLSLSYYIEKLTPVASVMAYIGSRSLFILVFHGIFMTWFNTYFGNENWFVASLSYFFSIVCCLLVSLLIYSNNYLSFIFTSTKNNPLLQRIIIWYSDRVARITD